MIETNSPQRKFMKELADLMQKHNASIKTRFDSFEMEGFTFNVAGKETSVIRESLSPKDLRNICKQSS